MKTTLLFFSFLLSITVTAQVTFVKGNFVNSQNVKTECLIKNYDWNNFPSEIEYKINEDSPVERIYIARIKSFYIYGTSHFYKNYDVPAIPAQPNGYSIRTGAQLLKVLVDGNVSLLRNKDNIYFLETEGQYIKPLISYKFINTATNRVEENNSFRLELLNTLKCEGITSADIRKVNYGEKSLIKIVTNYNKCSNSESKNYISEKTKAEFNIKLVAGVNFSSIQFDQKFFLDFAEGYTDYYDNVHVKSNRTNFVAGFEAEYKLPFNHKKWSLFIIPTYNRQKGITQHEKGLFAYFSNDFGYDVDIILTDVSYIELPVGIRRYFYLNKNSTFNLNVAYGTSYHLGTKMRLEFIETTNNPVELKNLNKDETFSSSLLRIGAGYTFKERYNIGLNYYPKKSLSKNNLDNSFSVMLGYKLF